MIPDTEIDIESDIELDFEIFEDKVTMLEKDFRSIIKRLDYYRNKEIDSKTYTHCGICNKAYLTEFLKYHKQSQKHIRNIKK